MEQKVELLIQQGNKVFSPIIEEGITWTTERKGCPGKLEFKVVKDDVITFQEGNAVRLRVNDRNVFYGFIFKKKRDKNHIITVTAYDQLRYLKNKDTYVYENKRADELVQMIAKDFNLKTGFIQNTSAKISRVEEDVPLIDIIQNALDETLERYKAMYILYDDFGSLTLKHVNGMFSSVYIDEETGENFDYTSSIDDQTYNKIKLTYDNEDTGKREVYIAQHGENINQWGVLQYHDTLKDGENGKEKANALLSLYNQKTRNLSIKDAFGNLSVRAGSIVVVALYAA